MKKRFGINVDVQLFPHRINQRYKNNLQSIDKHRKWTGQSADVMSTTQGLLFP